MYVIYLYTYIYYVYIYIHIYVYIYTHTWLVHAPFSNSEEESGTSSLQGSCTVVVKPPPCSHLGHVCSIVFCDVLKDNLVASSKGDDVGVFFAPAYIHLLVIVCGFTWVYVDPGVLDTHFDPCTSTQSSRDALSQT